MDFSKKREILLDLNEKYGDKPLVFLLRKLIITLDKSEYGSDEHHRSLNLLQLITNHTAGNDSGVWMDWLDGVDPEKISWEAVMVPENEGRLVIEDDEEEKPVFSEPTILSKEQALWTKALENSRNKSKFNLNSVLIMLIVFCLFASLYFFFYDENKRVGRGGYVSEAGQSPLNFWGNYHNLIPNESPFHNGFKNKLNASFMKSIDSEQLNGEIKKWVEKMTHVKNLEDDWYKKALWTFLWKQENTFLTNELIFSKGELNLNRLKARKSHWEWKRFSKEGVIINQGKFSESLKYLKGQYDWSIKRISGSDGSVHRVILNRSGLKVWVWKLVYKGEAFEGSLKRIKNNLFKLQTNGFGWKSEVQNIEVPEGCVLIPAIWTPLFNQLNAKVSILPISGELISTDLFKSDFVIEGDLNGDMILRSQIEEWSEEWKAI